MSIRLRLSVSILTAALLWFWMFSPWTSGITNFWLSMSVSAVILTSLTLAFTTDKEKLFKVERPALQLAAGVAIASTLWGIFWIGDRLSSMMFDFARPEVNAVYSMKGGTSGTLIAMLLLLVIGPAEELFWRGFVQRSLSGMCKPTVAFILTTLVYALVHIWSFNFMLVMAALVAGAVWGFLFRLNPRMLPALVISHAVWDALVFIILPI